MTLYSTVQKETGYGFDTIQAEHKLKFPDNVKWNTWWRGPVAFDSLETTQKMYDNLDVRYNTAAVQLTKDESGRVTGAIAKNADGYYKVAASKGVLLATGGYESNPNMVESWCRPEDYKGCCVYAPNSGNTGDGHMMGLAAGAQMDPLPHTLMVFRSGLPGRVMDASMVSKCFTSSIWTDFKGRRFVNEKLPHNCVANAISEAGISGKPVWFIFDQAIVDGVNDTTGKLAADIEDGKQRGELMQADTIEELATAMGAEADTLATTIGTWNSYFDAETPTDLMFRRSLKSAAVKIEKGLSMRASTQARCSSAAAVSSSMNMPRSSTPTKKSSRASMRRATFRAECSRFLTLATCLPPQLAAPPRLDTLPPSTPSKESKK